MKNRVGLIIGDNKEALEVVNSLRNEVNFTIIGDKTATIELAKELGVVLDGVLLIDETRHTSACHLGAKMASDGDLDILMKGLVHTGTFMKAVLSKGAGLLQEQGSLISLISKFELPGYHKPLYITDPGINIEPNIDQKAEIIRNAINVVKSLGVENPKVACISPVEVVNPKIQSSVDADILSREYEFEGATVEGPLSFDISVSKEAAKIKGVESVVAGDADILLMPNIDSGNVVYKSLTIFGQGKVAGVVAGLKVPVVLTSRADSIESKVRSLKLAINTIN